MRYAIIGAGMMGQEHIRNIALLQDAEVTAVADPDAGMRHQAATLAGPATAAFADHRELLAAELADVVIIASPNHTHVSVLNDVLRTPLPILVEKPLCTTDEDCTRILAAAKEREALVWVAMEYRYMPPTAQLLEEIRNGAIGDLKVFTIREHRYPFLAKVGDWNRFARYTGGTMVEKCCHFFDLMRLATGAEPTRVYASGGQDVNHLDERYDGEQPDIIDAALVIVDFDNGMRASLDLCMYAEGGYFQEQITAIGDRGKVEAFIPGPARFWREGEHREAELVISPRTGKAPDRRIVTVDTGLLAAGDHHGSTYFQHRELQRAIRDGDQPAVSLGDGAMAVRMGVAAEQSIRSGQPVALTPLGG